MSSYDVACQVRQKLREAGVNRGAGEMLSPDSVSDDDQLSTSYVCCLLTYFSDVRCTGKYSSSLAWSCLGWSNVERTMLYHIRMVLVYRTATSL